LSEAAVVEPAAAVEFFSELDESRVHLDDDAALDLWQAAYTVAECMITPSDAGPDTAWKGALVQVVDTLYRRAADGSTPEGIDDLVRAAVLAELGAVNLDDASGDDEDEGDASSPSLLRGETIELHRSATTAVLTPLGLWAVHQPLTRD